MLAPAAVAGGFETGPQGARILGLGGAATALAYHPAAAYYNPGALGMRDSLTRISVGGMALARRTSFLSTDTQRKTYQDLTPVASGYLFASHYFGKGITGGLSVTTPFGYTTKWPTSWEGRSVVQESSLYTVQVQPTVAVAISENFSVGAGAMLTHGSVRQLRALGQYDAFDADAEYEGSANGAGFNVGLYGRSSEDLSFGISYRSGVRLKVTDGTATFRNVPAADASRFTNSQNVATDIYLPGTLSVGLANQITPKLNVLFDFTLTNWTKTDSATFRFANNQAARSSQPRRYEDAMAFKIGGEYQLDAKTALRLGVLYDESPVRDEYVAPDLPDGNKLAASLGVSFAMADKLNLDLAYQFGALSNRKARANQSQDQVSNIAGTYRTFVHTAAVGLSYSF
ncbi:OmpP1/FadL family transporter [Hymenobacter guriensis]|uniref:Outer membrane protein transport protein n=1 Tax=Hymenobacter guriensis TaxID=2793065 RepID=A0ABS0KXK2_9BACT|nr:outer membrane protein transport protein [Hymenobacter guriensis]MBG8552592.1 outer membrane protein transport protein [Hymenobacter guriensis]